MLLSSIRTFEVLSTGRMPGTPPKPYDCLRTFNLLMDLGPNAAMERVCERLFTSSIDTLLFFCSGSPILKLY